VRYQTVFDASATAGPDWRMVGICFALVVAAIVFFALRRRWARWPFWPPSLRGLITPFAVFYLIATCFFVVTIIGTNSRNSRALVSKQSSNEYKVVEGRVTQFVAAPFSGHEDERFCVQEECFSYSDYVITGGFNTTSAHGGPIHEGLLVRISYVGGIIVKIEVVS
jgi:hypothetical protein